MARPDPKARHQRRLVSFWGLALGNKRFDHALATGPQAGSLVFFGTMGLISLARGAKSARLPFPPFAFGKGYRSSLEIFPRSAGTIFESKLSSSLMISPASVGSQALEKGPLKSPKAKWDGFWWQSILFSLVVLTGIGCGTPSKEPLVVQVVEAPIVAGRFRTPERQRDIWIAPQVVDQDILQHEQLVTFIERPQMWRLPQVIEPHTTSHPNLPLEEGQYDTELLRRGGEALQMEQARTAKALATLEDFKKESEEKFAEREKAFTEANQKLSQAQEKLAVLNRRLQEIEEAQKQKEIQEEQERQISAQKPWWKFW